MAHSNKYLQKLGPVGLFCRVCWLGLCFSAAALGLTCCLLPLVFPGVATLLVMEPGKLAPKATDSFLLRLGSWSCRQRKPVLRVPSQEVVYPDCVPPGCHSPDSKGGDL